LDIRDYDRGFEVQLQINNQDEADSQGHYFRLSKDGKMLEWWQKKDTKTNLIEAFSLVPAIQKWSQKFASTESYENIKLPINERTISFSGQKGSLRMFVEEAQIEVTGSEKRLEYCYGLIILKEK
jgi:hypothetical protein